MLTINRLIYSILFFIVLISHNSNANDPSKDVVEKIFKWAKSKNVSKSTKLQDNINTLIDFEKISKSILGKHLKKRSSKDQIWFQKTLKEMLAKTLIPKAPGFLKEAKVKYKKTQQSDSKNTVVKSVIEYREDETEVDYKLKKYKNDWKIIDIIIDGDSWVNDIKEQVQDTLDIESWESFKNRINKKMNKSKK